MKKIISLVLTVAMLFTMTAAYVSADTLVRYDTGFEPGETDTWVTYKSTDSVGDVTSDWAQVVTKAYGTDSDNNALEIKIGSNAYTEFGSFDTGHQGSTLVNTPVTGKMVLKYDFLFDSNWSTNLASNTDTNMITVRAISDTASATLNMVRLIKNSSGYMQIFTPTNARMSGAIYYDTWNRIIVEFDPVTGQADYTLITNVDNSNAAVATLADVQVTTANTYTGVNRVSSSYTRPNLTTYFDNLTITEVPAFLAQTAVTPENDATDVAVDGGITFTSNNDIDSADLKLNDTPLVTPCLFSVSVSLFPFCI